MEGCKISTSVLLNVKNNKLNTLLLRLMNAAQPFCHERLLSFAHLIYYFKKLIELKFASLLLAISPV